MRPYRTVLEQKIRERRMTLEEFAAYAEGFAREHGEPGTLSLRHLQRLVSGKGAKGQPLGAIRPATARLLERIFDLSSGDLLSAPATDGDKDGSASELKSRIATARQVDKPTIDIFREQLNSIRRIDRELGAEVAYDEVCTKAKQVSSLWSYSAHGNARRRLAALLAEIHSLAGWQALDLGKANIAWQHYEQAKIGALESEDLAIQGHVRAEQAFVLIDIGETKYAADCFGDLLHRSRFHYPRRLRAWLAAAYGESLAADDRIYESLRSFDAAEGFLPCESSDDEPYVVFDEAHFDRWRGHGLARCGRPEASGVLASALSRLDPSFTRAQAALRVDLSMALKTRGDHAGAEREARYAAQLAEQVGSERQKVRLACAGY